MCNGKPFPITSSHYRKIKFLLRWMKLLEQYVVDCQKMVKKPWKKQDGII